MLESPYIVPGSEISFNIVDTLINTLTELNMYNSSMEAVVNGMAESFSETFVIYAPDTTVELDSNFKKYIRAMYLTNYNTFVDTINNIESDLKNTFMNCIFKDIAGSRLRISCDVNRIMVKYNFRNIFFTCINKYTINYYHKMMKS